MRLNRIGAIALLMVLPFLVAPALVAAKLARVETVRQGSVPVPKGTLTKITSTYYNGDPEAFRAAVEAIFTNDVLVKDGRPVAIPVSFLFVASQPKREPETVRILLYPKSFAEKYKDSGVPLAEWADAALAGSNVFYDVLISDQPDATAESTYAWTDIEPALHAKLLAASKLIDFGPIAAHTTKRSAEVRALGPQEMVFGGVPDEKIFFSIVRVTLPGQQGKVTIDSTITTGNPGLTSVVGSAEEALSEVRAKDATSSKCGVKAAEAAAEVLRGTTGDEAIKPETRAGLKRSVESAIARAEDQSDCSVESKAPEVLKVQNRFEEIVSASEPKKLANKTIYTTEPLQRFSVALIAAGRFSNDGDARAKLNSGKVEADPLGNKMSIIGLYVHPLPYLAGLPVPSKAERLRLLTGYVVTPEPGIAAGLSWLAFRGLTINVGYAGMLVQKPKRGIDLGSTPNDPDPLQRGVARSWFAGFGYDF